MTMNIPIAAPSVEPLAKVLRKRLRRADLAQLMRLVTDPAVAGLVASTAVAMIERARTGCGILANPFEPRPGAIDLMVAALHRRLDPDEQKLVEAFAGTLNDLADLPDAVLAERTLPPTGDWLKVPASVLAHWLRSNESASGDALHTFDDDMGIDRDRLADQLRRIDCDPEARTLVHGGHLGTALRLRRRFGSLSMPETDDLIRGFARLLVVIIGHLRTALLRRWSRQPMTKHVRFDHDWQTLGRSMMTGVVGPAAAIAPILAMSGGPQTLDEVSPFLAGTPLGNPAFEALVADAMGRLAPATGSGRHGFDDHVERVRAEALKKANKVAGIRYADLQGEKNEPKLTRTSFVTDRLGISASEGTVLVGWSMLSAPETIDACIEAVKAGRPLPAPVPSDALLNPLAVGLLEMVRATDLLRRAVNPDREASKLGAARRFGENTGIEMVRHTMADFAFDPPQRAIDALWVDPRPCFA